MRCSDGWASTRPSWVVSRVESYEHLGDVQCFLHPLDAPKETDGLSSNLREDELATHAVA
jgi:hypothetical protein